jgi:hypothetical protein
LQGLNLDDYPSLDDTATLAKFENLRELSLQGCSGLKGKASLQGIVQLKKLLRLNLSACSGLEKGDVDELRQMLGRNCTIYGP